MSAVSVLRMARRNPALSGRVPLPHEYLGECAACDYDNEYVPLLVAAKWPDTLWYRHHRDLSCPEEGHLVAEDTAEYYCPRCHLVYESRYDGPMEGRNYHATRQAAVRFLGKPDTRAGQAFCWVAPGACDQGATRPVILMLGPGDIPESA